MPVNSQNNNPGYKICDDNVASNAFEARPYLASNQCQVYGFFNNKIGGGSGRLVAGAQVEN
jgi:hypothetical protein